MEGISPVSADEVKLLANIETLIRQGPTKAVESSGVTAALLKLGSAGEGRVSNHAAPES